MSQVLTELPVDQTLGLELVDSQELALEATRHIALCVDLLDPARRLDIGLERGGEELPNRCLRRSNGLLPRCEITPMEFWGIPLPMELFPDGVRPYKLKGEPSPSTDFNPNGAFNPRLLDKPLFFMPLFPGDLIYDAVGISANEKRGIVEIQVLKGENYGGADREFQELFFGGWQLPLAVRLVRDHIEQVADSVLDPDAKSVANDLIQSCDQGRDYMAEIVSIASTQLQTRVSHQYTHRLTPKIRHFMAQLELKPNDNIVAAERVEQAVATVAQSGISGEQLEQILTRVLGEVRAAAPAEPAPTE